MTPTFAVVIPTVGRPSLARLLEALGTADGPAPERVIVVDDRVQAAPLLPPVADDLPVTVLRSGGRGPAAARNVGWRATRADWICFLDDDVEPGPSWRSALATDLSTLDDTVVGSQGRVTVPVPAGRRPSDDEQRTIRLATARWITADMAYRRSALLARGGFDERFRRAYREDSDIAVRLVRAGGRIVVGSRQTVHPIAAGRPTIWSGVRAQRGNRDDALMRRKHGRGWRAAIGEQRGRLPAHLLTTGVAVAAVAATALRARRIALAAWCCWLALTAEFSGRRISAGPGTLAEALRMVASSAVIPPTAVAQRGWGTWLFRHAPADPPLAVLLDRDDTLIADGPYLNDPAGVMPLPDASRALARLRDHGLRLGVVTNQSGVAKGLISAEQLNAVNARVDELLGPFDCWQVCVHDNGDGCDCRKPLPGLVISAADALGVTTDRCVVIGDTGGDVAAAHAANARAILVPTARTRAAEIRDAAASADVAGSLDDAVSLVLKGMR